MVIQLIVNSCGHECADDSINTCFDRVTPFSAGKRDDEASDQRAVLGKFLD